MKTLLLFATLALSINVFGQSKKEQIITLNNSIDSLNTVLKTTRDNASKDIGGLNTTIVGLNSEITQLKSDVSSLESSTTKLTKENDKFKLDLGELSEKNLELEAKLKIQEINASKFEITPITVLPQWAESISCIDCIIYPLGADEMTITEEEVQPLFIYDIEGGDELYFILNGEEKRVSFFSRKNIENGNKLTFKGGGLLINVVYNNCGFKMKRCVSLEIYNNNKLEFRDESMTGFF